MKVRKRIVALVLLAMLAGAVGLLAGTTVGLRFLAARVLPMLPVTLDPNEIEGRLVGPIALGRLEIAAPGLKGEISSMHLDWRPAALLRGMLHIKELRIAEPRLELVELDPSGDAVRDERQPFSLPFTVILERLAITSGALRSAGETMVEDLDLELSAEVSAQAWDIDLRWQLSLHDTGITGRTRVQGPPGELSVAQEITAPLVARIDGIVRGLPDAPWWALNLVVESLPSRVALWPEALDGFAAHLRIEGELEASLVSGSFELPAYLKGPTDIEAQGGWAENVARVRRLELGLWDGATLSGSGWFEPGGVPGAEFMLSGTGLGWPLDGTEREVVLPRAELRGTGTGGQWDLIASATAQRDGLPELAFESVLQWAGSLLTIEHLELRSADDAIQASASGALETGDDRLEYRVTATGEARLPDLPRLSLALAAAGDAQEVRVETLAAELLGGTVSGAGRVTWAGDGVADFQLEFAELDPSAMLPDWPGRLAGSLELSGQPASVDGLEITLRSLRGELRSLPVSGEASLNVGANGYLSRGVTIAVGDALLQASGRLDDAAISVAASFDVPELKVLDPRARGKLNASVNIAGARAAPRIELNADGEHLRWQANRARGLHIEAVVDLSGATDSEVLAELAGFATASGPDSSLRLEAVGIPELHRARLELLRPSLEQSSLLALEGGLAGQRWSGLLTELILIDEEQPVWSLQAPAELGADTGSVSLGNACMDGIFGLLCIGGNWHRAGAWRGSAKLSQLDLEPLSRRFGQGRLATGVLTGGVELYADDKRYTKLSGGLELTAGGIRAAEDADKPLVSWVRGSLGLTGDEDTARAELSLELEGGDHIDGRLAVGWNAADPPLDGRIAAELSQLHLLPALVPEFRELQGNASLEAAIAGTVAAPALEARFELHDGLVNIPTLGLQPDDIQIVAILVGGNLGFKATGRSGDGRFETEGGFDLTADGVEGRATLTGTTILLANVADVRVEASPNLRLNYSGRDITIGGDVVIPFARITELGGPTAVSASPDEVLFDAPAAATDNGVRVSSRVRVNVGPDVQVQAAGLSGSVEGSLLTVIQPELLPWGRGELRVVDGTFSAFGQRLEIQTGRLIYSGGPLENPGLEIRAVRRIDQVIAGALVRGTLQQPEISVYSDPPMPRAEALSYLTLGRSLNDLQSSEQRIVNQAANSLALSGGTLIAQDLGRRLGFDEVAVTAGDDGRGAAIMISRYLGGGVYVGYGLGLFDTVNTLRLRFQINQRLSLEAISGEEQAGDLIYTFERD